MEPYIPYIPLVAQVILFFALKKAYDRMTTRQTDAIDAVVGFSKDVINHIHSIHESRSIEAHERYVEAIANAAKPFEEPKPRHPGNRKPRTEEEKRVASLRQKKKWEERRQQGNAADALDTTTLSLQRNNLHKIA